MLAGALSLAGRAASRSGVGGALGGVRVFAGEDGVVCTGTDLDLTVRTSVDGVVLDSGCCVVPAKLAADIVRAVEPGSVVVEADSHSMVISAGRARFEVKTFDVEDFPVLPTPAVPQVWVDVGVFTEAVRQTVRAASTDDTRPVLTGVLATTEPGGVRLVATDSYRLSKRDVPGVFFPQGADQALIPARALVELLRLFPSKTATHHPGPDLGPDLDGVDSDSDSAVSGEHTAEHKIGLSFGELEATFTVGHTSFTTRLFDGKFPDWQQLIPTSGLHTATISKAPFVAALRRAQLFTRERTTPVLLRLQPGSVSMRVVSHELGSADEEIDAVFDGDELTVAFNPRYLADGVDAVPGEQFELCAVDAMKPAVIQAVGGGDYLYLLMPVRVG
jgi:DNA polymerase-3 subunit beta